MIAKVTPGFVITVALGCLILNPATIRAQDSASDVPQNPGWESALYTDHVLVGRIWHSHSDTFIESGLLLDKIENSKYLLLGEKHDNPDHHQLQLQVITYLIETGGIHSLSLEMLDSDADSLLLDVPASRLESLSSLKEYLSWDDDGWNWSFYGSVIMTAIRAGIPLYPANITNTRVSEIYGQPADEAIASVLDTAAIEQLYDEIDASHCNMLPASQFPAMVGIQQARDHQMAMSLNRTEASEDSGRQSVLIAGNYHIRQDLGVPNYLMAMQPDLDRSAIVSLAFMEVNPDSVNPRDYLQAFSERLPFDYVWFTPAISNEDYCAGLTR